MARTELAAIHVSAEELLNRIWFAESSYNGTGLDGVSPNDYRIMAVALITDGPPEVVINVVRFDNNERM